MDIWKCCEKVMVKIQKGSARFLAKALFFLVLSELWGLALGLGSMSSIAISYGENGPVFCGLKPDGSHLVTCYGSNSAIIYATPAHSPFTGLTAGSGFVCGLLMDSKQPYCWGSSGLIQTGVPQPMSEGSEYLEISAGDHHVCGLRKALMGRHRNISLVDCWGYNMTTNNVFDGQVESISAGSEFNCGLFSQNKTVFCWGDETSSRVISLIPREMRFQKIAAGGFHVCGIVEGVNARVFCWGRSLELEEKIPLVHSSQVMSVDLAPNDPMLSVVGGRFHACGIKSHDGGARCWGYRVEGSTGAPNGARLFEIAAGDYFTCGVAAAAAAAERSLLPVCWGAGFPSSLPLAVSPGLCKSNPCATSFYEFNNGSAFCKKSPATHICLPCTNACPAQMYQKAQCTATSDQQCEFNCSICASAHCFSNCSYYYSNIASHGRKNVGFWSLQLPVIAFAVFLVSVISLTALLYVRCKLRSCSCRCRCSAAEGFRPSKKNYASGSSLRRDGSGKLKFGRARIFSYKELEKATGGFTEESQVGKGSFSCVFRGVLKEGTVVAVKRATVSAEDVKKKKKSSKELFHNELDLLSRLNHAHLLNLLGYCEEGGERLLVYEFMANGSLHQHLHGKKEQQQQQLDWIRRVTIAVQAARGIEYLHGYACPPVIHRDIKSSNILIDEEQNARVSDFGLSLLGPANSSSPLAELPAGTLGYLDPEYYRLHYLTTKSDVYSFGVLLLEIVSGRKAIDMQFEEGNIVEWAVPLIKAGDIQGILDPVLETPSQTSMEALKRIANVACKCVRMRGKERPSMDEVTTALERALAQLMGNPSNGQPILPTEVVLGSSRLHNKSSQRSSNRSTSETESEDHRFGFRAPSWITFPSTVASSQRWKSSVSDAEIEGRNLGNGGAGAAKGLRSLEEEIGPASPQQNLFLHHNF